MPLEPPALHRTAACFAPLLDAGLIGVAEALPHLISAAQRGGYDGDLSGLRARLAWTIDDHALALSRERRFTERAIQKAIAPMLAQRQTPTAVLAHARAINATRAYPLPSVVAIVRLEAAWWVRTGGTGWPT